MKKNATFYFSDKTIEKLNEIAKQENRSQSNMLTVLIDEKFETLKK